MSQNIPVNKRLRIRSGTHVSIGERIAKGGWSDVFRIRNYPSLVIKRTRILDADPDKARARLMYAHREVDALKAVGPHSHIISMCRRAAIHGSNFDLIFPRYDCSLHAYARPSGVKGGMGEALGIMCQILSALEACHSVHVVHRDVKPDNILVDRASGRAVLADFGLAKKIEPWGAGCRLHTQEVVTRGYRAPEFVLSSRPVAYAGEIDIFALGCVLPEIVSGRPLFTLQGPLAQRDTEYRRELVGFYEFMRDSRDYIHPGNKTLPLTPEIADAWYPMMDLDPKKRPAAKVMREALLSHIL